MHTAYNPQLNTVTLALSGASGMAYGLRLLECLLAADLNVYLLVSQAAHLVAKQELGVALPARARCACWCSWARWANRWAAT